MMPSQLQNDRLKFCKIKKGTKKPFERNWVNNPYTFEEIKNHISKEINYGVMCGYGGLIVIDCDNVELKNAIALLLPKTFVVKTGSGGTHYYYFCNEIKKKIVLQDENKHFGEVQSYGTQVVGAGSIHPSGNKYEVVEDNPIAEINKEVLFSAIKPFMKEIKNEEIKILKDIKNYGKSDINSISILSVVNTAGFKKAYNGEYYGSNPWHGSKTGVNFWINPSKNIAHCWRCDCGMNVAQAIALNEGIIKKCDTKLAKDEFLKVLEVAKSKYGLTELKKKNPMKVLTDRKYQTEEFGKIQPIFYDKAGLWWLWNSQIYCWEIVDEVDILNMIEESTGQDVIAPQVRTTILNSLKQYGRKKIPKVIRPTWIQFKEKIYDIKTGEILEAIPDYFVTNPIPWDLHKEKFIETPVMDRIFKEWVGEKHIKTLYEILAYCLLPDYPIHRLFCFIGSGSNGKGCFLRLLKKFVGEKNVTSTELDTLLNSRFEITRLYKKLVCIMGETNFSEISKTSIIKKLTGQDLIGFEYKNKNLFEGDNYAKIIIATNNLPTTTDKTIGFYRRWFIIDFPNRFSEEKKILDEIPEEEYNSLALKCCLILKDILDNRKFTNEGSIEERQERYESKSNFLENFIKETISNENVDEYITVNEFYRKFASWCKEKRHREMSETSIGMEMKKLGYEQERKYFNWMFDGKGGYARVWVGIKWR